MTGSLIRDARKAEGLTQAALARRLGITQPAIARLEAAGDEVSVATLRRALHAMHRALVLEAVDRPSSVDETLLHRTLAMSPAERLASFEQWYAGIRKLAHEVSAPIEWPEFRPAALLRRLADADVEFVVVGGLAAVIHGSATITRDLDIVYSPAAEHLDRLRAGLVAMDARVRGVSAGVPFVPDSHTFGQVQILALDTADGWLDLVADTAYARLRDHASEVDVADVRVRLASLDDLIALKRTTARPRDLVAVEELEAIQRILRERS